MKIGKEEVKIQQKHVYDDWSFGLGSGAPGEGARVVQQSLDWRHYWVVVEVVFLLDMVGLSYPKFYG